jgi:hypothetical protein
MLGHPGAQIWVTPGCPLSHPGESPSPDEISQPASPGALAAIAKTKTPAIMWDRKVRGTLGLSWLPARRCSSGSPTRLAVAIPRDYRCILSHQPFLSKALQANQCEVLRESALKSRLLVALPELVNELHLKETSLS